MQNVRPRRIWRRDVTVCKVLGKTEVENLPGLRNNFTSVHTHTLEEGSEDEGFAGLKQRCVHIAAAPTPCGVARFASLSASLLREAKAKRAKER